MVDDQSEKECYICGTRFSGSQKLCPSCQVFSDGVIILNVLPFHLLPNIDKEDVIEMLKNPEIVQLINRIQEMSAAEVQNNLSSLTLEAFEKIDHLENKNIIPTANRYFQKFLDFKTIILEKREEVTFEEVVQKARLEIAKGDLILKLDEFVIPQEDLDVMISLYKPYYILSYFQLYYRVESPVLKIIFSHEVSLRQLLSQLKSHRPKKTLKIKEFLLMIKEIETALKKIEPFLNRIENKVKNADKQNLFDIINSMKKKS